MNPCSSGTVKVAVEEDVALTGLLRVMGTSLGREGVAIVELVPLGDWLEVVGTITPIA